MWRVVLLSSAVLAFAAAALAETYVVNPEGTGDFPTIQGAINAVVDGDIIELTDGTFTGDGNRDIDYLGKAITVQSQSGNPYDCVIDCEGSEVDTHRGFHFHSQESHESALEGVTVTGGYVQRGMLAEPGGGVYCTFQSSPSFIHCVFHANTAGLGGGMFLRTGSEPILVGCVFAENIADSDGGLACAGSFPTLTDCTFDGNTADLASGGMGCHSSSIATLTGCTFYGNAAPQGAGMLCFASTATLENTIISFSIEGEGLWCDMPASAPTLTCCDIYGNEGGDWVGHIAGQYGINGNISEDPLFCDPENHDFALQECSPCAPFSPPNPECDLIGAWPVGCGGTPTTRSTWGGVKALFRE